MPARRATAAVQCGSGRKGACGKGGDGGPATNGIGNNLSAEHVALKRSESAIRSALELAGAKVKGRSWCCPFHEDHHPSAGIYQRNGAFRFGCRTCGFDGDVFDVRAKSGGTTVASELSKASGGNGRANQPLPIARRDIHVPSDVTPVSQHVNKEKTCTCGEGISWRESAESFCKALRPESLEALARELHVSTEALEKLGVGFNQAKNAFTFPMRDARGCIVGLRVRSRSDLRHKWCESSSTLGLFYPDGALPSLFPVFCEGETDTAAGLTLGMDAIGVPGAGNAIRVAVEFVKRNPVAVPTIIGDNDPDGRGHDGSEKLAAGLLGGAIPCRVLFPPPGVKDLRDWLIGGLTRTQLSAAINETAIRWPQDFRTWPPGYRRLPNALARRGMIRLLGAGPFAQLTLIASYGTEAKPGIVDREELGAQLGISVRQVSRNNNKLAKYGFLNWDRGGTGRANVYRICLPPIRQRKPKEAGQSPAGASGRVSEPARTESPLTRAKPE